MEFTGERVVPGKVDPDLLNEHLAVTTLPVHWSKDATL